MRKGLLVVLIITLTSVALADPSAYLTEQLIINYEPNKTVSSSSFIGWAEVSVNNPYDILQFIRLNLSGIINTNLISPITYRAVASSPNINDLTRLYHNTTESDTSLQYLITNGSLISNNVTLGFSWNNIAGGTDLNSSGNLIQFNITLKPVQNTNIIFNYLTFLDCYGGNDCMNVTSVSNGLLIDRDSDGFNDAFETNLSLNAGVETSILFNATINPNSNYYETLLYTDTGPTDSLKSVVNYPGTFTGITFNDLFSRGPVTQGIDLTISNSTINARCFMKNEAVNLSYVIHSWALINVTDNSTIDQGSPEALLDPGSTYYTHNINVNSSNKDHYSCAFDWETVWELNSTSSSAESRINGPLLYELNVWASKTVTMLFSNETGRGIRVNDTSRHLGHSTLGVDKTEIVSIIPHISDNGAATSWSISDVKVIYRNSTGYYDITGSSAITVINATTASDGQVRILIDNLSSIIGRSLMQNEDVILSFNALATPNQSIDTYSFSGNTTMWTDSGTPDSEVFQAPAIGVYYCPPCPTPPICPTCPEPTGIPSVEERTKSLFIDLPWIVEAVLPSDSVSITFKNAGETVLRGLSVSMNPRFNTLVDYNPGIGDLQPNQEKTIIISLSNLVRVYDYVFINVTDGVDYWTSAFVIYVPGIITPPLGIADCIDFSPRSFLVSDCFNLSALHCNAYDETCGSTRITVNIRNKCEASLINVAFTIEALDYYKFVSNINKDYNLTIDVGKNPPRELLITASYDGGFSTERLAINSMNPVNKLFAILLDYGFLWGVIFILALVMLFIITANYFVERRRLKKALLKERGRSLRIKNALSRIQELVSKAKRTNKKYNELLKELKRFK